MNKGLPFATMATRETRAKTKSREIASQTSDRCIGLTGKFKHHSCMLMTETGSFVMEAYHKAHHGLNAKLNRTILFERIYGGKS